jgi:hypothetical protein
MNNQVRVPVMEQRDGKPVNNFIKVGPFTLHESNKGSYWLYTVKVTDGVVIYKQASRPNLEDIIHALHEAGHKKIISKEVFLDYNERAYRFWNEGGLEAKVQHHVAAQKGKRK